jgi:hypothetical protein
MSDLEKRWDTKLPQSVSMHVLRRPVETTGYIGHARQGLGFAMFKA